MTFFSALTTHLIIDLVLVILLPLTLVYCWRLGRSLRLLRSGSDPLERTIGEFSQATVRMEAALAKLRTTGQEKTSELETLIQKAETVIGDLELLLEKAEQKADRLEMLGSHAKPTAADEQDFLRELKDLR